MWIRFTSKQTFAVKIHVGGVNAVSGEPSYDTEKTLARRYMLLNRNKSIQDHIVTPKQLWLDGIASKNGTVRQFVALAIRWRLRSLVPILLVACSWRSSPSRRNLPSSTFTQPLLKSPQNMLKSTICKSLSKL